MSTLHAYLQGDSLSDEDLFKSSTKDASLINMRDWMTFLLKVVTSVSYKYERLDDISTEGWNFSELVPKNQLKLHLADIQMDNSSYNLKHDIADKALNLYFNIHLLNKSVICWWWFVPVDITNSVATIVFAWRLLDATPENFCIHKLGVVFMHVVYLWSVLIIYAP